MISRTSRPRSAWSCATNMYSDTDQAITLTTPAGARSRSNSVRPRASRPCPSTPRPATTLLRTDLLRALKSVISSETRNLSSILVTALIFLFVFVSPASAQIQVQTPPPPPPEQNNGTPQAGGRIKLDVNLVVLHTAVLDDRGKFVDGLTQDNFRVYEDKVEQKLSIFKREDIPVSMGLVIDNSGSMRDKRPRVNEAALTLVQSSNPQDEAFVVNFNDDFYLDLDKDFTSSIPELKEALERIDARGSTALYDAINGCLDHLKKETKEKKVLLIVTDGEDNTSRNSLEKTIKEIQKTDTVIYTIGLLGQERQKST